MPKTPEEMAKKSKSKEVEADALNQLSQRAQAVLLGLKAQTKPSAEKIISLIEEVSGIGSVLLKTFPPANLKKSIKIDPPKLVKEAYYQAIKLENPYVGTEHLLLATLKLTDSRDYDRMKLELVKIGVFPNIIPGVADKRTPVLDIYSQNLNHKAIRELDKPTVFREDYHALVSALLQQHNSNVLLVGDDGVGKEGLVELLARNTNSLDVPVPLIGYQVVQFDLLSFMTSILSKGAGDFGLAGLVEELKGQRRIIVYLKDLQNVFFSTVTGFAVPLFFTMLKAAIENANIRIVASMNNGLYDRISAENDHILNGFTVIEVNEPDEATTLNILAANANYLASFHNVEIPTSVIKYVYIKAREEVGEVKFPVKGLHLLDQACTRLLVKKSKVPERYKTLVDKTFLLARKMDKQVGDMTYDEAVKTRKALKKIEDKLTLIEGDFINPKPCRLATLEVDEALEDFGVEGDGSVEMSGVTLRSLNSLASRIKRRIIGQDEAVDALVKALVRAKLGLRPRKRPVGSFLFLGPTGVGKTELAKVLADEELGEKSLIRLDMSDFAEKHTVARLVGAPPGYVGYGEGGQLTERISQRPASVVLFDEIEKAHPDVLNILLQILEEGELADAKGSVFDFSKSIIILTSNLGTELLHDPQIGFGNEVVPDEAVKGRLKLHLKKNLRAELLNRLDEIIIFARLSGENQLRVINLLIDEVSHVLAKQKVQVKVSKSAKNYLLGVGYSEEYGARSLRRTIEREFLDRIAQILLESKKRPLVVKCSVKRGRGSGKSDSKGVGKKGNLVMEVVS